MSRRSTRTLARRSYKNVSKKPWGEWVERQKMLLNEYRLQPWTREAQDFLVEQMNEFFFGEGGCAAQGVCGADARSGWPMAAKIAQLVYT